MAHPENFDHSIEDAEREDERKAIKEDAQKKLFKEIYGAMIDNKYSDLSEQEIANTCLGVLTLYKNKFLGYARGVDLSQD